MNKVDQMWYLLHVCYDFTVVVNPFFRAVEVASGGYPTLATDTEVNSCFSIY